MTTSPQRVLVLGAAGFFGTAVTAALLNRGIRVSALIRRPLGACAFTARDLTDRVNLIHGSADDAARLRQTIAIHEVDCVVQAAAGANASETHELTHAVLAAVAGSERRPMVAVPLRNRDATLNLKFQTAPQAGLDVAFVRLPELFGPGDSRVHRWPASLFFRAALDETLMPSVQTVGVYDVDGAAEAFLNLAFEPHEASASGRWLEAPPFATSRELFHAVKDELGPRIFGESGPLQDAVAATLAWYRKFAAQAGQTQSRQAA